MKEKRKEEINSNVKALLKNHSTDEIGLLGVLLTDVIQKKEEIRELERDSLMSMLADPDEEFFKGEENQFLSEILSNEKELQYFVSSMQKNIVKELEAEENKFPDEDIEKLRDFFTLETLENLNVNKQNPQIRKLIIALWCNENIVIEECHGISGQIDDLIEKINEFQSKAVLNCSLEKALDIIYGLKEYLES